MALAPLVVLADSSLVRPIAVGGGVFVLLLVLLLALLAFGRGRDHS
jgi:hypothetical protein